MDAENAPALPLAAGLNVLGQQAHNFRCQVVSGFQQHVSGFQQRVDGVVRNVSQHLDQNRCSMLAGLFSYCTWLLTEISCVETVGAVSGDNATNIINLVAKASPSVFFCQEVDLPHSYQVFLLAFVSMPCLAATL